MPKGQDIAETRVVEIVRDVVKLEEQAANKAVLDVQQHGRQHRIGVVTVPTFYIDFKALRNGDPNYTSTTRDVARLIGDLKTEGIDGLIVDLRNNGGGSLQEAVETRRPIREIRAGRAGVEYAAPAGRLRRHR